MNFFTMKKIMLALAMSAMVAGGIPLAAAQGASDAAAPVATPASGITARPTKAERKAARKQARATKNAELKKLEGAGYQPGKNNPNYPADLQNAQKKAGIGTGASQ